jgi:hypothetical protein
MIVREAKLKHGTAEQYSAIDEAIRTAEQMGIMPNSVLMQIAKNKGNIRVMLSD